MVGQILHVHVSFICFYFYLNAILPLSDHHDILTEILLKVALNTINQPTSFWTPTYQHDYFWTYFQKPFWQGFCIHVLMYYVYIIRVITKLPNTEQSSKGKGKTHQSTNRQNPSTTGKLGKLQWPWLGTGISKEMVGWIRFYGAKPPASITVKRFRLSL